MFVHFLAALRHLGRETSQAIHSRNNNFRCKNCTVSPRQIPRKARNNEKPAPELYMKSLLRSKRFENKFVSCPEGTNERNYSTASVPVIPHNSMTGNYVDVAAVLPPNALMRNSHTNHFCETLVKINSEYEDKSKGPKLLRCNGNNELENNVNLMTGEDVDCCTINVSEYLVKPTSNTETNDIPRYTLKTRRPDTLTIQSDARCISLPLNQHNTVHEQKVKSSRLYNGSIGMSCLKRQSPEISPEDLFLKSRKRPYRYYLLYIPSFYIIPSQI